MKTIGLVRRNIVCLGEAALQLKLNDIHVPQAQHGTCALLAACNTTSAGGFRLQQVVSSNCEQVGACHSLRSNSALRLQDTEFDYCVSSCSWIGTAAA